jgi:nitrile hydratase subunit beta
MNGVFDLGGTDGLGPVHPSPSEPAYHAEWEKSLLAIFAAGFRAGLYGMDSFRHGIELMDPSYYLNSPYYEHWLHSVEHHAITKGAIDPTELDRRTKQFLDNPDAALPEHDPNPELLDFVNGVAFVGASARRPTDKPVRFDVGDVVRVRSVAPLGHTRMARYVRGKVGTVVAYRGSFIFPDSAGNELGEDPQHVYTVQFDGAELWGEQYAEPNTSSTFDVWDPYIEPAEQLEGVNA